MRSSVFALVAVVLAATACSDGDGGATTRCVPHAATRSWPYAAGTGSGTPALPGLPGLPALPGSTTPSSGALTSVPSFGDNPGGLAMYVHAPPSLRAGAPVVVALHGCTQSAAAYANAGWNALADTLGFLVIYAEQSSTNDMQRCFRWWDPAHTTRDKGEARSIRSMVDAARAKYGVDDAFVTGLSAGGAMTAVMLATYPEVFRAGAIMSGLPYHCAQSKADAYGCMSGKSLAPAQLRALLPPDAQKSPPRVSIWHGDADYVVRPTNATALVDQWTAAHHLGETPSASERVGVATHDVYRDAAGTTRVELWMLKGMSHGVALDPKGGCGTAGAFMLDEGLCSAKRAAEFFGIAHGGATSGTGTNGAPGDCSE